jgi:hypothetical protein
VFVLLPLVIVLSVLLLMFSDLPIWCIQTFSFSQIWCWIMPRWMCMRPTCKICETSTYRSWPVTLVWDIQIILLLTTWHMQSKQHRNNLQRQL